MHWFVFMLELQRIDHISHEAYPSSWAPTKYYKSNNPRMILWKNRDNYSVYVGFITSTMLEWCCQSFHSSRRRRKGRDHSHKTHKWELMRFNSVIFRLSRNAGAYNISAKDIYLNCLCVLCAEEATTTKTSDAQTRRGDPTRFVHKICSIQSSGLDHVAQSAIFGRSCPDELLLHRWKSISKCFPRHWRANSISQQPADSLGGHDSACSSNSDYCFHPAFCLSSAQCVYTAQRGLYRPARR